MLKQRSSTNERGRLRDENCVQDHGTWLVKKKEHERMLPGVKNSGFELDGGRKFESRVCRASAESRILICRTKEAVMASP